jgi:glycosyltransferase involved in cell wall biosynthesis
MKKQTKILFLANWPKSSRASGKAYAFFAHFKKPPDLSFLGTFNLPLITWFEKTVLKFYILQPLAAFFKSSQFDIVLAYSSQSAVVLGFLFRLFGRTTPLVVFDVESFGRPTKGIKRGLIRYALKSVTRVVYASSGQKKFYQKYLPEVLSMSTHIPIGIGEYDLPEPEKTADIARRIVAIGKHGKAFRDWKTLLEGFAALDAPARLTIIGREDISSDDRQGVAIPPDVDFLPFMPIAQLGREVVNSQFAVLPLPERRQSLGQLSVLFIMAMGKAPIVSRVVGVEDYVEHEKTGLLFEPGNPVDLAACMKRLLEDPELAQRLGSNARRAVLEKFSAKVMGQRWEKCLNKVIAK